MGYPAQAIAEFSAALDAAAAAPVQRGLACVDAARLFDGNLANTAAAVAWIRNWGVQRLFVSLEWVNSARWQALEPALRACGIGRVWLPYTEGVSSTMIRARIKNRI